MCFRYFVFRLFSDQHSPEGSAVYKVAIGLWIFSGLAWLAMVFQLSIFYIRSLTNKIDTEAFEVTEVVKGNEQVCCEYLTVL